jgi:hypothetical protein
MMQYYHVYPDNVAVKGFWIKWSDLLDIQQAGLQLVVTQSYCNHIPL